VIKVSRERYGKERSVVEEKILKWSLASEGQKEEGAREAAPVDRKFPPKEQPAREMHDAECSECKRSIKLPFKPDPGRPVYCKECFEKRKARAAEKPVELNPTVAEKPKNDQAELGQSRAKLGDRVKPDQGQAKSSEIALNKLPDRAAAEPSRSDRSRSEAGPRRRDNSLRKPAPATAAPRKEVDLESLRSTLGDIAPKSKDRGIMEEGEEVNL